MKKWLEKVEKAKRENAEFLSLDCDGIEDISALGLLSGLKKTGVERLFKC